MDYKSQYSIKKFIDLNYDEINSSHNNTPNNEN